MNNDNKRKAPADWAADVPHEDGDETLEPPPPPPPLQPPANTGGPSKPAVPKEALLVCSDLTWKLYEPWLAMFYDRVAPDQCLPELLFEPAEEALPELLVKAMHHLMTEFIDVAKEERLLELDARVLPHAKLENDTVTRIYLPYDVQQRLSRALEILGELSKKHGFLEEQTM